jgi:peroxiredoxin family protein
MTTHGRLSLIVSSGDYDRVHYALAMASAATATARPATLFFTMAALKALLADRPDGLPGWAALAPAPGGQTAIERDASHAQAGIATMEELIAACIEFGTTVRVCEMGLKAEGLATVDLRPDVPVVEGGLVSFLAEAERDGGQIVFI